MNLISSLERDSDPLAREEVLREHINRALRVKGGTGPLWRGLSALVQLWCRPQLYNVERIPEEPCLFVGNHALFGLDGLVMLPVMQRELGRFLRPMGDRALFAEPRVASLLLRAGRPQERHPDVARALMARGEDLLVFPGGAHEAVKPARQRYSLQWKDRLGFVRLAAENGYPIVPFAMVGPDEFYDYLVDGDQILAFLSRLGLWSEGKRSDIVPPLPRGVFGSLLPRPQPCYLSFGKALHPGPGRDGKAPDRRRLLAWRRSLAGRIEEEIAAMLLEREQQRHEQGLLRRLANL